MKLRMMLLSLMVSVGLLIVALAGVVQAQEMEHEHTDDEISPEISRLVADIRHATADFRNFDGVEDAGYGKFLECFVNNEVGGMGQHYVNGELVGDDVLDPMTPEALVFEPTEDGDMILVAFEYLVFADQWDPENTGREAPMLFDQEMHLKTNIPDTPPVWTLHLWLWTGNPDGLFADYNPTAFCPEGQPITDMTPASS